MMVSKLDEGESIDRDGNEAESRTSNCLHFDRVFGGCCCCCFGLDLRYDCLGWERRKGKRRKFLHSYFQTSDIE